MTQPTPQSIWQGFHWSFFINVQGLIISLRRFEAQLALGNLDQAQTELSTATKLLLASGASMELAGSFSREAYQMVRESMTPPQVRATNFSGLMSWEHAALMQIWKRLRPIFATLPNDLQPQHQKFIQAYFSLVDAHKGVCEKFGGTTDGSLRFEQNSAIATLDQFSLSRWQLIDPTHSTISKCPFSYKH
ncbi:siderophore biosynthesis protein [Acaryochloris sp. IP29b_bin.137]|uniref:siderophore biosynthesis protein n=1 Tax=Acaryochloris sp. IP29b_bin.137 TaxID=2969217 RepID=UPI0026340904|nr:siderophore biosynthesis protein [Acaryochloris sp. IP29b_bin.137]